MFPDRRRRFAARVTVSTILALSLLVPAAGAVRLLNYNILNYPGGSSATRNPHFRTIIGPLAPDIVCVQEMESQTGVNQFSSQVLNTLEPGQWASAEFDPGNDTNNALYYRPAKFAVVGTWPFYPNPSQPTRVVHVYRLRPVGYASGAAEIRLYSVHLKASQGFESQREAEAAGLRDSMNAAPPGTHCIILGDFNLYTGAEPALTRLIESQADNDGRVYDPLGLQGIDWQDNASMRIAHTQSPCRGLTGVPCASGASTGGVDDRFDLILPTYNWNDGQGYELIAGSYVSVGNDGNHLNLDIDAAPTIPEGLAYAQSLKSTSDHLPVRVDFQLPARIATVDTLFAGDIFAAGSVPLLIGNPATPPADALTYSFTAPAGFSAPGGTFNLAAGATLAAHLIGITAGPEGPRTGALTIATDAPDHPLRSIALTANVLRHADASLDSTAALLASSADFGVRTGGSFGTQTIAVHNRGWDAQQGKVFLTNAVISGGAGRFVLVRGFTPIRIAGVGQRYEIAFISNGATPDSAYAATLTFSASDDTLPGAQALAPLQISLSAQMASGPVAVGDLPRGPKSTRLYAPSPNPVSGSSTLRFDLAKRADLVLEVFDVRGRRVSTLAQHEFEPGSYSIGWNGRMDSGAAIEPGVYFVRLSGKGLAAQTARIAVVH